jgi:hypothetical protein
MIKRFINRLKRLFRKRPRLKFKYKAWSEVPLEDYYKISEVATNDSLEPIDRNVKILSLLTDTDEDKVWAMDINDAGKEFGKMSWVWSFKFPKSNPGNLIKVGDRTYSFSTDLQEFSIAQYIDFQTLWPGLLEENKFNNTYTRVLSILLVPEGKDYNTGYNLKETQDYLLKNLSITKANQIYYFFMISLQRSIRATEIIYELLMKILKMRTKSREKKEEIEALQKKTTELINQAKSITGSL